MRYEITNRSSLLDILYTGDRLSLICTSNFINYVFLFKACHISSTYKTCGVSFKKIYFHVSGLQESGGYLRAGSTVY